MTMPVESYLYFPIIILLGSIPRFYLLFRHGWVGKDTFYHFIVAESIRKKGFPPRTIDQFVMPEQYDYPPLFHVFLSYFDKLHYQRMQYLSPVSDIFTAIVIFIFSDHYLGIQVALIATFVYLVTPYVLDNAFSLNPRSFANLFLVLSLFSWYNYYISIDSFWLILSVLFSSLVLLCHRLTTQCWGVLFIALTLWTGSWVPLMILVGTIIVTVLVTKGYYLTVMKGHGAFIREFGRKFFVRGSRTERAPAFPSVQHLVFNLPLLLVIPLFLVYPLQIQDTLSQFMLVWIGSLIVLSIGWVFGEGVRHMICAVPAIAILWALWIVDNNLYLLLVPLGALSITFLVYKIIRLEKNPDISGIISEELMMAFDYIKAHRKPGDILLCLPLDLTYNAAFFTDCIVLQSSGGFAKGLSFNLQLHKRICEGKIGGILAEYSPRWIITVGEMENTSNQISIVGGRTVVAMGSINVYIMARTSDN